ncbi:type IV pilus secretin PilQ [Luteimonas sp. S4-F44]|uniref:type IV pilus secretin PilQ n=1 Tax=Luteimonas sp. S4-F44 TaxID=2925842 RepID=UPI001F532D3F|nr:type IV pilus secretin PilQ [Luteimonas sp. S4-F44]UNK43129.1 type IV pilus secretin PilQ [Luteimonas sp. S4-F44]
MTVSKAGSPRAAGTSALHAGAFGLAIGMLAAFGGVHAAQPAVPGSLLPALQASAGAAHTGVSVTDLDFKRGDGGSGKLILRFDGEGAAPDLRTQDGNVVINLGSTTLPAQLQRPLNVVDFATPVQRIDARQSGNGAQVVLSARGDFEPMAYQSGRDYIVEIVPRAASSDRAVGASTAAAAMGQAATTVADARAYSGRPVTFNFQDVPVRTVLQLIADESDLNIVASDSVAGNVTLRLQNVPWDQALDIVLQAKSLDKRRSGNVVWVAPQSEIAAFEQAKEDARLAIEERAEMTTEYIPISYGNAEDIAKLLTEESKNGMGANVNNTGAGTSQQRGFLSARGSLSFDRRTNTLLVIDIPARVNEIRRLVTLLDKPVDQVVIEARIVIANESFARDLGARFGVSTRNRIDDRVDVGGTLPIAQDGSVGVPGGLNVNLPVTGGAPSLAFTILGNTINWAVELQALQTEQRGEVISNPRVVTSNQREATISQGQEIGYLTVTGGQSNNVPTVQFKDVLLELKVTPTITNDGRVFLAMDIKKDEVIDTVSYPNVGEVPLISKRNVTTAVLIDDGQTVAIGGVYEFADRASLSKVPFLGDLPILGNLFKSRGRTKEKAELLIFVTPKVMRVAQRPIG